MRKVTFGVIVGNRGFFPDTLAKEGRKDILDVLKTNGYGAVALPVTETKCGAVETLEEADKCAELFASKAKDIDGVIVSLPNFGDERGIVGAIKRRSLGVPIPIPAEEDTAGQMGLDRRRDSFCGKISGVKAKLAAITRYTDTQAILIKGLLNMARFGTVVGGWIKDSHLFGTVARCRTALEQYLDLVPCMLMSMMREPLLSSVCEVGVLTVTKPAIMETLLADLGSSKDMLSSPNHERPGALAGNGTPEKLLSQLSFWIPRQHREEMVGDIREDFPEMRAQGMSERRICIHVIWQVAVAIVSRRTALLSTLKRVLRTK